MTPPLAVTEDTPADMLAGSMDLELVLPGGDIKRFSAFRSTPMMDLLVQVTTANRLSPGSHSLEAMGPNGPLRFQPSTPVGALDTLTVRIVRKKSAVLKKAPQAPHILPQTLRLAIHLPRAQLFVTRVTPDILISDIMKQVCEEKNLNPLKYELRVTGQEFPVKGDETIGRLKTTDLTLVVRGSDPRRHMSSADIIQVKQANNRQSSLCDSSLSSGSLESRSISPVAMPAPQPPQRKKRRPAPKPPDAQTRGVVISHSRESSDSSGYHEPSTLSDSPTHGGPPMNSRTSQQTVSTSGLSTMGVRNSQSMSNLTHIPAGKMRNSESVSSLSSNGVSRKKRAPPPPPVQTTVIQNGNDVKTKASTLPASSRLPEETPETKIVPEIPLPPVELAPSLPIPPEDSLPDEPVPPPRRLLLNRLTRDYSLDLEEEPDGDLEEKTMRTNSDLKVLKKPYGILEMLKKQNSDLEMLKKPNDDLEEVSMNPNGEEVPSYKPKSLKGSRSSNDLLVKKIVPKLQKTYSAGAVLQDVVTSEEADEDFDEEAEHEESPSEPDADSQPDSLSVDWQYQLPPPPTHFRDMVAATPTPTDDSATLDTFDTRDMLDEEKKETESLESLIIHNGVYEDKDSREEGVVLKEGGLNGVLENLEVQREVRKSQLSSVDKKESLESRKIHLNGIYEDLEPEVKKIPENAETKVLLRKMDVMNELTNVLDRNRLSEKSQSFSNLHFPTVNPDAKRKTQTLSHSQSFAAPLISNFKISDYESREDVRKPVMESRTLEDVEFRKPRPVGKANGVRRADSMNVKSSENMDLLKQKFWQFMKEREGVDVAADLEKVDMASLLAETIEESKEEVVEESMKPAEDTVDAVVVVSKPPEELKVLKPPEELKISKPPEESKLSKPPEESKVSNVTTISIEAEAVKVVHPEVVEVRKESPRTNWLPPTPPSTVETKKSENAPKRSSWQPPSISMGTWGERPKTKVLIKDADYTTEVADVPERKPVEPRQTFPKFEPLKPVADRKLVPAKKPTNYELFSALSRRRDSPEPEVEEETRPPVVCAVELKKEFRSEPDLVKDLEKPEVPKTSKVYVNAAKPTWTNEAQNVTKARPVGLMPVVKGFRNENKPEIVKQVSVPDLRVPVSGPIKRQESLPTHPISLRATSGPMERQESLPVQPISLRATGIDLSGPIERQECAQPIKSFSESKLRASEPIKKHESVVSAGIPPPPPMGSISLRPVAQRQIKPKVCDDSRGMLLEQIRSFGGSNALRKTVQ